MKMKKQVRKNLFRRTYEKTQKFVKAAALGAALSMAAGCGARSSVFEVPDDSGRRADAGADVVQFDVVKPVKDSGVDSQVDTLLPGCPPKKTAPAPNPIPTPPPPKYTHTVNNLIGDYLNRELLDRDKGLTSYSFNTSETSSNANPFSDGAGGTLGPQFGNMHRIDGSVFPPFMSSTLMDTAAGKTYSEQQDLWVAGHSQYSEKYDDVVGLISALTYSMKFSGSGDQFGIPVCTTPTNSVQYAACKNNALPGSMDYATETHRLQIKFLGETWVITDMTPPSTSLDNEQALAGGGTVKIAKVRVSGILNKDEALMVDDFRFRLDDIETHNNTSAAVISVIGLNDVLLKKDKVSPWTTKEFTVCGKTYLFHVYKLAPGYPFGAKWADVAIFNKELKLMHNTKLDPDYNDNKHWKVYLGWKNKGANVSDTQPDHLRSIIIVADDIGKLSSGGSNTLEVGDYIRILSDPQKLRFSYNGLTAKSTDYSTLRAELESLNFNISPTYGPKDSSGVRMACSIHAPYVKIKSSINGSVFTVENVQGAGSQTSATGNQFIVATSGASCNGSIGKLMQGALFMNVSSSSQYWAYYDYTPHYLKDSVLVKFPIAGDGVSNENVGNFAYAFHKDYMYNAGDFAFAINEEAGTGVSKNSWSILGFALKLDGANSTFNFDGMQGGGYWYKKDSALYMNPIGPVSICKSVPSSCFLEEGGITDRGSKFVSMTDTLVEFKIANTLVYSQFMLVMK
jgi:hypothetical protein